MVFTIYCCGTGSSSFDAYGAMDRPEDEWDKKPKEYEALWQSAQNGDKEARTKLTGIWETRRQTVGLRKTYFQGEIVSTLAKNNTGKEYADWILVDGPGSGNHQNKMLWAKPGNYSETRGQVSGAGVDENVRHAVAVLKNVPDESLYEMALFWDEETNDIVERRVRIGTHGLDKKGKQNTSLSSITPELLQRQIIKMKRGRAIPDKVNLIGWSRGAVTCIMIANAIAADPDLKHVQVRIFAVDPVPGGTNQEIYGSMTKLPKCVTTYFGVYARDEVSRGFSPVIPKVTKYTSVTLLAMPGMHATVAGNSYLDKKAQVQSAHNTQGPGRITRYWAEECLIGWGTKMQRTAYYTDRQLCDMYDEMLRNDSEFGKMRGYSYTGMKQGALTTMRQVYVEGSGTFSNYWSFNDISTRVDDLNMMKQLKHKTFVNWHHEAVFKRAHKTSWRKLNR
jgi:hypothetical protein